MRILPSGWNIVLCKLGFTRRSLRKWSRGYHTRRLRVEALEYRQLLAATMVSTDADLVDSPNMSSIVALNANPGADGKISLREAITAANADAALDEITFVSSLNGGQILLNLANGPLEIANALTIDASALQAGIVINGNDPTPTHTSTGIRIFNITDPTNGTSPPLVTLVGLTLKGADSLGDGGAIYSAARLTVRDCIIQENEADRGGAIFVQVAGGGATPREVLRIENSIIDSNYAFSGGGLALFSGSAGSPSHDTVVITGSTFRYHELGSSGTGGAIQATLYGATLTVDEGTFLLNEAHQGGAIHASLSEGAELNIVDSSFQENDAILQERDAFADGGGVYAVVTDSTVDVSGTAFIDNLAGQSGAGLWLDLVGTSTAEVTNSLLKQNKALQHGGGLFLRTAQSEHLAPGQPPITVLTVQDSRFEENEARDGGGLALALGGVAFDGDHLQAVGQRAVVTRSKFSANKATNNGGGIRTWQGAGAELEVVESTISGNFAGLLQSNGFPGIALADSGGGIYSYLFSGDDPVFGGDPFDVDNGVAKLVIAGSTIDSNQSGSFGGGIAICAKRQDAELGVRSRLAVVNSTISGNSVLRADEPVNPGRGGGVAIAIYPNDDNEGMDSHFENATVTKNRGEAGGGIWSKVPALADGRVNTWLTNTIIAGNTKLDNTTGSNFYGSIVAASTQSNLFGPASTNTFFSNVTHEGLTFSQLGPGNLQAANNDPQLSGLGWYGGPTWTHQPLVSSPAIDVGSNSLAVIPFTTTALATDQRGVGFARRIDVPGIGVPGEIVDVGAVEYRLYRAGDYNRNGTVDAADYTIWRDTLGGTVAAYSGADGDGNGVINANDYVIWKAGYGFTTGLVLADFSRNGATDIADYNLWASTSGSTTDLRADCNEDGIVDNADYEVWFDTFGSTLEIGQFGLLSSMFAPDAPPTVVGFALSLPGDKTIDFAGKVGSGEQIRSVPLTAANTLSITFSQDVTVTQNALQVTNLDGASPSVLSFTYDAASQTATWTFAAAFSNGRYLVQLSDTVENLDGQALDGEFFNPTSLTNAGTAVFPSGDGDAGGEFRFRFTVLFDDSDHDNILGAANYQNWQSTEPGMIIVSTTADDYDGDLSFGDVSLREAVNYANNAAEATAIQLPAGRYSLTLTGTEVPGTALNDLDVSGNVAILGAGAGLSVIVPAWTTVPYQESRVFEVSGAAARLRLEGVTVTGALIAVTPLGAAALVHDQAELEIVDSAIVNNIGYGTGVAVRSLGSDVTILRSVFTNNQGYDGVALWATEQGANTGSLTIGESIFALNNNWGHYPGTTPNVKAASSVLKSNLGHNLYDSAAGGFFDVVSGAGDHLGTPQYVVTTVADTFDHANNVESLSIREAVDKANTTAGTQEIWIPAWKFVLTRDRGSLTSDVDTAFGDLDVKGSTIIRGVSDRTSVDWKTGIIDKVFELAGDANSDGQADFNYVSAADYTFWQDQNGSSGDYEEFSADFDDDGDVDQADYDIWSQNFGHTLLLFDVLS